MKRFLAAFMVLALTLALLTGCGGPIEITLGSVDSNASKPAESSAGQDSAPESSGQAGSGSSAASRTVVAPMEIPARYTGSPPQRFSAQSDHRTQSCRSNAPNPIKLPPLSFCPL